MTADQVAEALNAGNILDLVQRHPVQSGDTVFMPPAPSMLWVPVILLYEVQQTSDITYRVYDWDRPAVPGRALHLDKALKVLDPGATTNLHHIPDLGDGHCATLAKCPYFTLELISLEKSPVALDTAGLTLHILTAVEGEVELITPSAQPSSGDMADDFLLRPYESVVIPAACAPYQLRPSGAARVLKASVE